MAKGHLAVNIIYVSSEIHLQRLLGDEDNSLQPRQIAKLTQECDQWRKIVVTCAAGNDDNDDNDDESRLDKTMEMAIKYIRLPKVQP